MKVPVDGLSRQVIEAGRWLLEVGLTDGTSGNISVRHPEDERILITPSARDYRRLSTRDVVWVHLRSGEANGRWKPSSEWRLHTAIYQVRPDVHAIIHYHPTWASAVAVARKTIPVLIDEAVDIGPIPTTAYAPSGSQELAETAARELAQGSNAVLLANHGAVAVGGNLRETMHRALEVERLAKIYLGAALLGGAHALNEVEITRSQKALTAYRATQGEERELFSRLLGVTGQVHIRDLIHCSLQFSTAFSLLFKGLILKFRR